MTTKQRTVRADSSLTPEEEAADHLQVAIHQSDSGIDERNPHESVRRNVARMRQAVESASTAGTNLVVFGEGFLNGYLSGAILPEIALVVDDRSELVHELIDAVNECEVSLIFGATTSKGSYPGSLFNSAVILVPGGAPHVVDKAHLSEFRYKGQPVVTERMDWAVGKELSPIFDIAGFSVAVEICHDIVFPEVSRSLCLKGAELIVNVSAAVAGFDWFWNSIPSTRAFENGVWYVHATVVSTHGEPDLLEHSRVVDPFGSVVAEAPDGVEHVLQCTVDRKSVMRARAALKPFTERRPDIYDQNLSAGPSSP